MPSRGELDQTVYMFCAECADERLFERPECLDGHGGDCPERACVECGAAILVGPLTQLGAGSSQRGSDPRGGRVVRPSASRQDDLPARTLPPARRAVGAGRAPRSLA